MYNVASSAPNCSHPPSGAKAKLDPENLSSCMFARLCLMLVACRRVVLEALIPAMPKGTPKPVAVRC